MRESSMWVVRWKYRTDKIEGVSAYATKNEAEMKVNELITKAKDSEPEQEVDIIFGVVDWAEIFNHQAYEHHGPEEIERRIGVVEARDKARRDARESAYNERLEQMREATAKFSN